jgi:hypothetical protein
VKITFTEYQRKRGKKKRKWKKEEGRRKKEEYDMVKMMPVQAIVVMSGDW